MFWKFRFVLIFIVFCCSIYANELEKCIKESKKYNLSICAVFKNEERYLREWIEYHRLIGVDHFYLYDNCSKDRSIDILIPYIREGLVTLIHWPDRIPEENVSEWALSTQLPAYENVAKYRGLNATKWLAFIDVDEYLVPVEANTVLEILEKYENDPGLELISDYFDAYQVDVFPKRELLITTTELIGSPQENIRRSVEKIIFKPELHTTFSWPPYKCHFQEDRVAARPSKKEIRINKYVNRFKGNLQFNRFKEKLFVDYRLLTENQTRELLENGFKMEDRQRCIFRFENALRKNMGMQTGWCE